MSHLKEQEKIDLEKIQYETYIKLDMYVEALENSGKFNLENGMYLKSGKNYYNRFKEELNSRNENIWLHIFNCKYIILFFNNFNEIILII